MTKPEQFVYQQHAIGVDKGFLFGRQPQNRLLVHRYGANNKISAQMIGTVGEISSTMAEQSRASNDIATHMIGTVGEISSAMAEQSRASNDIATHIEKWRK